jgi:hypothetical protein
VACADPLRYGSGSFVYDLYSTLRFLNTSPTQRRLHEERRKEVEVRIALNRFGDLCSGG